MFKRVCSVLASVTAMTSAFAVELETATDQQILNELAYRLRTGGGTPSQPAQQTFTCAGSNGYTLYISHLGADATETVKAVVVGYRCADVARAMTSKFNSISKLRTMAVCSGSNNYTLFKYVVSPTVLKEPTQLVIGYTCETEAGKINAQ